MTGAYYNEIDPYAAQWLRNLIAAGHIAPGDVDERSIADVRSADLVGYTQCHFFAGIGVWSYALRLAGWPDDRPVWTGSCPCQPFSPAGKRAGVQDERHLWPAWFRLIRERVPVTVFGEQVADGGGLAWFDAVQADLEARDYAVGAVVLPAAGVGAPHGRHRLFFVADADIGARGQGRENGAGRDQRSDAVQEARPRSDGRTRGVADAAGARSARGEHGGADRSPASEGLRLKQPARDGAPDLLAHPERDVRRPQSERAAGMDAGPAAEPDRCRDAGRVVHADLTGPQGRPGRAEGAGSRVAASSPTDELGDAEGSSGSYEHGGNGSTGQHVGIVAGTASGTCGRGHPARGAEVFPGDAGTPGPLNGFWADADWLYCRDGAYRPVEPGSFPLAHGIAARMGRLRAYGNAICAPVAAAFVEAYMTRRPS